jgi:hypothetical protein
VPIRKRAFLSSNVTGVAAGCESVLDSFFTDVLVGERAGRELEIRLTACRSRRTNIGFELIDLLL